MTPREIRRIQNHNRFLSQSDPDYDDSLDEIDAEEELFEAAEYELNHKSILGE